MKRRKNKGGEGDRGRSEYASWFWKAVRRTKRRKLIAKMQRVGKRVLKKYIERKGVYAKPVRRQIKNRGHDGTMFGPFRSRGT